MSHYNHEILYKASPEQLREIMEDWLHSVKRYDPDMHEELEADLYEKVNGPHFDREQYDRAVSRRSYRNGRQMPKWTVEQISDYARRQGDRFERYNEYDLAYEMNSTYDDYYDSLGENPDTYYRMARQKLDGRDGQEGRAWQDYRADTYNRGRGRDRLGRFTGNYSPRDDYDRRGGDGRR